MGSLPIDKIKSVARIDEVAQRYTKLTARGGTLFGICPLHDEKTPSFSVNPRKGVFYCFGCGEGGDVISLVQKAENVTFKEAVSILAAQYGIEIKDDKTGSALAEAWEHMRRLGDKAREYLRGRGIEGDFAVGYDDGGWVRRVDTASALEVGILKKNSRGRLYSPFRDRVVFPVTSGGMLVGLTGRDTTGRSRSKWFHSNFARNSYLFGLDDARKGAKDYGALVVVEGPLDAVKITAAGYPAVAAFGASLSAAHASRLAALGVDVYLGFDRDQAGLAGTLRALGQLRGRAIVRIVVWPGDYNDPGEMGASEIGDAVSRAIDPARFLVGLAKWKYPNDIDRVLKFLSAWLTPVTESDPLPAMLRRELAQQGIDIGLVPSSPRRVAEKPRSDAGERAARLMEADLAAVIMSVQDREQRSQLADYVELHLALPAGPLLVSVLDAMRADDPLGKLQEIGAGGIFYRRILEAPEYSPESAWEKVRFLTRSLNIKILRAAMESAERDGDFDRYMELASALEAIRRGRRTETYPQVGV